MSEEDKAFVERILSEYVEVANKSPALLSLLWDWGLMPEQIESVDEAKSFALACQSYKAGQLDGAMEERSRSA